MKIEHENMTGGGIRECRGDFTPLEYLKCLIQESYSLVLFPLDFPFLLIENQAQTCELCS